MNARRAALGLALLASTAAVPAVAAPAGCPRLVDVAGDASYGSLGKGSSDLDIHELQVASGPRTVVVAVRLASMAGTATELRLGARVDARISLTPVDYFFAARRAGDGSWRFTMTAVRIGSDGRPVEQPAKAIAGKADPAAAEVVFVANRSDFVERFDGREIRLLGGRTYLGSDVSIQETDRVDGSVGYRDRSRACRLAG
ncbi:MAG TPA: hypothetical protein VNA12_08360 [Mycobacteriales bacterium]|nr:hypothetical protein [Mycobacteriales bacterium]